ncbi:tRNA-intron lyase [Halobellus rufus]|uniref:tRNA-intron lyase n=1 Tax=Halobellus rufus TaxID=1448860 RepID=UPI000679045E|nr:tRNA-intron lyase [Halobellus rufus]
MDGTLADGVVRVGGDARQRFYDARGYGRPLDRNRIELAPVEAAHLLSREDLDAVVDEADAEAAPDAADEARLDFRAFLVRTGAALRFAVYKDLRDRGFYLSPAREDWPGVDAAVANDTDVDFVVYPRGKGPWDDEVAYRVRVVGERESVSVSSLGEVVLAVVDEDGDLTYFETDDEPTLGDTEGATASSSDDDLATDIGDDLPTEVDADLLEDRVVCYDADDLYENHFYGQRLFGRNADEGPIQLSLVEGAYLAERGVVDVESASVVALGRDVEGERFDRRLRTYAALRDRGVVPKSGFKFGADFRVYEEFTDVDSLSHSTDLVRVLAPGHAFYPRDLSLDVRLAGGVRKRMVFALTAANGQIDWLSVARLTP